jgi:hypothetical protein
MRHLIDAWLWTAAGTLLFFVAFVAVDLLADRVTRTVTRWWSGRATRRRQREWIAVQRAALRWRRR